MIHKYNKLQNICKVYVQHGAKLEVLRQVHIDIAHDVCKSKLQKCTTTWTVYWTSVQSGWLVPKVHMKPKFRIREIIYT